jgi:arylsulfatase A-like enzyme
LLISTDQATLGTVFQKAGYRTAAVGKWHVGLGPEGGPDWNGVVKPGPDEVGFDHCFIFPATADRVPTVYVEDHRVVALDSSDPIRVSFDHKVGQDPTGKDHYELLKLKSSMGHDGTIINGIGRIGWMAGGHRARWVDEALAGDFFEEAQSFIEKNRHHPFFLYYAMNEIHVPRMPDTRFKGKSKLGYRGDVILEMDYFVGKLMKTLDWLRLTKNTLVIFTSDNGPVVDDGYADQAVELDHGHKPAGPFRGGKYSLFEGGTRVPFIIRWPGVVKPGTTSDALVSQVDLLGSFAAMLHVKLTSRDAVDSRNTWSTLTGRSEKGSESGVEQDNNGNLAFVRDGWKYIPPHNGPSLISWARNEKGRYIESGLSMQPQLYNLKKYTGEQHNLVSKYPQKAKEMAVALQKIKEEGHSRY